MVELREYVEESNAIEDVHDESAIEATVDAWDSLRNASTLTHDVLKSTHERIMESRQPHIAGQYRDVEVYVKGSGRTPPPPAVIEPKMDELLAWRPGDPVEALEWHVAFEQIHPFQDGNGRTGRLIYFWHCREQLDVEPIMWRAEDREGYYELFQSSIDGSPNSE